ncbi:MAG: peptidoglycan-binding domain-containing protein [Clostridia bacterium]|nr:peptidoglycan-binding domain-containing protein [Clostridia bacterium]MDD4386398.1 peptidoglycan-binding domain-containing protein [Clostridia bacterium]
MAKIIIYNPSTNRMEVYYRGLTERMPYANNMTVREFRGSSKSDILWTDKRLMDSWNILRSKYGSPIKIGYAFKRIGEGGHTGMSQHYAGLALDMGQNLSAYQRDNLRNLASSLGIFTYIEPKVLTPTWVHVDKRFGTPACSRGGYPLVKKGSSGVYVAILQDALNTLGHNAGTIDGVFGTGTMNAVIRFQKANGLSADGIVGCSTWERLTSKASGAGI